MSTKNNGKALVIGIDQYDNPNARLGSCINDAQVIYELLNDHFDGSSNFDAQLQRNPTCEQLRDHVLRLLNPKRPPTHALLYFSGHGHVTAEDGFLVGRDYSKQDIGISMEWLAQHINASSIPEITLIFDCCYAAAAFDKSGSDGRPLSELPENVTLLAAVRDDDVASAGATLSKFTQLLAHGLRGGAADARGHVTAASLYQLIDPVLTLWDQRPVFKSFVTTMSPLRECKPKVHRELLEQLTSYDFFANREEPKQLQPKIVCTDPGKPKSIQRFAMLVAFQQAGLIQCPQNRTVYEAALRSETCELTSYGRFFLELLDKNRI